ncbi:MAG: hypothetical protein PHF29_04140 [Candidatus Riflebacteria bacterium]|nr:hypothetical protein [Candidatus Riflebacteria bacterium]
MILETDKLGPICIEAEDAKSLKWSDMPENMLFFRHICKLCSTYPSIFLSYSATKGVKDIAQITAQGFTEIGVNVFMAPYAVPICAFSQAIALRNAPIGLYISKDEKERGFLLTAITSNGGLFDLRDISNEKSNLNLGRTGVIGETNMTDAYIENLAGLADSGIEPGIGFKNIRIPFPHIDALIKTHKSAQILNISDKNGLTAIVGDDGQQLTITDANGSIVSAEEIASKIMTYLQKERFARGTIIGQTPLANQEIDEENYIEVKDSIYSMHFFAASCDLLLGWWPNGVIAHQGSSCFGDGILSAIYYIEALRSL